MLNDRCAHVYDVFRWVTQKQYFLACDVCKQGWKLDTKQVENDLKANPIPFGDRYGWIALLVIVALLIGLAQFDKLHERTRR